MKKITLFVSALCLCVGGFAQNTNWFQSSDQWYFHIQSGWVGSGIEHLWVSPVDTTIGNKTYRVIERKAEFDPSNAVIESRRLVRQDGKKIYTVFPWTGTEMLLYDFGMSVGDTVWLPVDPGPGTFGYVVSSIETIQINGHNLLKQEITWLKGNTTLASAKGTFIESIGNVEGLHLVGGEWCLSENYLFLDEPGSIISDGEERIFCSFQNDQIQFEGIGETFCAALATDSPIAESAIIYPNPGTGTIRVGIKNGPREMQVDLFDPMGRLIQTQVISNYGELSTGFKGVAVVLIRTENGVVYKRVLFH